MVHHGTHRPVVALVAAYALALQGLLAAFAMAPAPALDAAICSAAAPSHGGGGAPTPAHHPDCPLCPLVCGGAAPTPALALGVPAFGPGEATRALPAAAPVARAVVQGGLARAPPA